MTLIIRTDTEDLGYTPVKKGPSMHFRLAQQIATMQQDTNTPVEELWVKTLFGGEGETEKKNTFIECLSSNQLKYMNNWLESSRLV